jgi:hypothetical protein
MYKLVVTQPEKAGQEKLRLVKSDGEAVYAFDYGEPVEIMLCTRWVWFRWEISSLLVVHHRRRKVLPLADKGT